MRCHHLSLSLPSHQSVSPAQPLPISLTLSRVHWPPWRLSPSPQRSPQLVKHVSLSWLSSVDRHYITFAVHRLCCQAAYYLCVCACEWLRGITEGNLTWVNIVMRPHVFVTSTNQYRSLHPHNTLAVTEFIPLLLLEATVCVPVSNILYRYIYFIYIKLSLCMVMLKSCSRLH